MKISMEYGSNTFGNTRNAPQYSVRLNRASRGDSISIRFDYASPAAGRGVGGAQGSVRGVSVDIPRKTAEALSHALQLALSDTTSTEVDFAVDENQATPAVS